MSMMQNNHTCTALRRPFNTRGKILLVVFILLGAHLISVSAYAHESKSKFYISGTIAGGYYLAYNRPLAASNGAVMFGVNAGIHLSQRWSLELSFHHQPRARSISVPTWYYNIRYYFLSIVYNLGKDTYLSFGVGPSVRCGKAWDPAVELSIRKIFRPDKSWGLQAGFVYRSIRNATQISEIIVYNPDNFNTHFLGVQIGLSFGQP